MSKRKIGTLVCKDHNPWEIFSQGEGPVKFLEVPLTALLTTATRDALVDGADLGNAPLSKTI